MNPKLPTRIMLVGLLAIGLSVATKNIAVLSFLSHSPIFEWGCGIAAALAFTTGMFLALCGLVTSTERRRTFFALHLIGLLTFCSMLTLYFLGYTVLAGGLFNLTPPDVLPKLIENTRSANSEATRKKMAENAYEIYGVTLAYRLDNGEFAYYQPTEKDAAFRDQFENDKTASAGLRRSLAEDLPQFPWLFSFYLGSFFVVYLGGTLWLLFRKSGPRP